MPSKRKKINNWLTILSFALGIMAIYITLQIQYNITNEHKRQNNCDAEIKYFEIVDNIFSSNEYKKALMNSLNGTVSYDKFYSSKIIGNKSIHEIEILKTYFKTIENLINLHYNQINKTDSTIQICSNLFPLLFKYKEKTGSNQWEEREQILNKINSILKIIDNPSQNKFPFDSENLVFFEAADAYLNKNENKYRIDYFNKTLDTTKVIRYKVLEDIHLLHTDASELMHRIITHNNYAEIFKYNNSLKHLFLHYRLTNESFNISPLLYEISNSIFFKLNKQECLIYYSENNIEPDFYIDESILHNKNNITNQNNNSLLFTTKFKLLIDVCKTDTSMADYNDLSKKDAFKNGKIDSVQVEKFNKTLNELENKLYYTNLIKTFNSSFVNYGDRLGLLHDTYLKSIESTIDVLFDKCNLPSKLSNKKTKIFYSILAHNIAYSYSEICNYSKVKNEKNAEDVSKNIFAKMLYSKCFYFLDINEILNAKPKGEKKYYLVSHVVDRMQNISKIENQITLLTKNFIPSNQMFLQNVNNYTTDSTVFSFPVFFETNLTKYPEDTIQYQPHTPKRVIVKRNLLFDYIKKHPFIHDHSSDQVQYFKISSAFSQFDENTKKAIKIYIEPNI